MVGTCSESLQGKVVLSSLSTSASLSGQRSPGGMCGCCGTDLLGMSAWFSAAALPTALLGVQCSVDSLLFRGRHPGIMLSVLGGE